MKNIMEMSINKRKLLLITDMFPNEQHISKPLGATSSYIFPELSCNGCNQRSCPSDYRCIKSITPSEVIAKTKQLLGLND